MASLPLVARVPRTVRRGGTREMPVALMLLVISVFISYVDRGNLSVAAPMLKTELGLSASCVGLLLSSFFWGYTVCLFICGWFVDRFDVDHVLAVGFLLWSLATAATGIVHGFTMLLIARLLLGVGESVSFPCYSKILAQHLPEDARGFANGAIIAGMKLGPAVGTLGAGLLMTHFGWRLIFIGIGLTSLLWLPAWMKWRPRRVASDDSASFTPSVREIFRQRVFWANSAAAFCAAYPLYFTVTWFPLYLVHEQRLSMPDMVRMAAMYYTVDAIAALATGWATDQWIRRGKSVTLVRKAAMAVGVEHRRAGILRVFSGGFRFIRRLAHGDRNRAGCREFRSLGLHPNSRRPASRGTVGGLEERFFELVGSDLSRTHRFHRRLDRALPIGYRNHGGNLCFGCDPMGFRDWGSSTGGLETVQSGSTFARQFRALDCTHTSGGKSWQRRRPAMPLAIMHLAIPTQSTSG